jgi:ArsR family transcriptional regulator
MELEKYFKALADNTRLRILNLLLHGELCGCDVQHVLGISQPNISRHLTYLKNSGLVRDRRVGFRIFYRLADPAQRSRKALFDYLRLAFRDVPVLVKDMERLKDSIKDGACTVSEWRPYAALTQKRAQGTRAYSQEQFLRATEHE